jgi:hypothetical protein
METGGRATCAYAKFTNGDGTEFRDHPRRGFGSYPTAFVSRRGRTQLARGKWQV